MNELDIFAAALELSSRAERAAFLVEVCGPDTELRQRIESLLRTAAEAGSFLENPAVVVDATLEADFDCALPDVRQSTLDGPGTTIGSYKLLQKLGEGGMGTVYLAEQHEPVQRRVALKIIRPGMDSRQVIARFEAERQALALMDHHHIARVLDAGTTQTGRPFFAMELVKGMPITKYCDQNKLTPRERLELFIPVCHAIQHAHQKGIIHRDIKPSNVLVTLYDGKPVPKVIDFGIAKAIQQKLTERTLFTEIGQLVGTPEYMSPEQTEMNQLDIDTRSDIYSLGVLLYELLTGSTPITKQQLREAGLADMLRTIRETDPPKPSTRIDESKESLPSISAVRRTEPDKLSKLIQGDLDWIVMKALEKDRTRRYETADAFATDVERFLTDEVVQARPPTIGYRVRKFARRHRILVSTVAAIVVVLMVATVVSSWFAVWALNERRIAQTERDQKEVERQAAEAAAGFLVEAFRNADPLYQGRNPTVADMLDQAEKQLAGLFHNDPAVQSRLLDAIGQTYIGLSPTERAVQLLRQAHDIRQSEFGEADPRTIRTLGHLAFATYLNGDIDNAIRMSQEAVDLSETVWRRDDPESPRPRLLIDRSLFYTAAARNSDEVLELCLEALRSTRVARSDEHVDTAVARWNLARAYIEAGRPDKALPLAKSAEATLTRKLGPDDPRTIRAAVAAVRADSDQAADSHQLATKLEDLYRRVRKRFGDDHQLTNEFAISILAYGYLFDGQHESVLRLVEPALRQYELDQGYNHFVSIRGLVVLSRAHALCGDFEQSRAYAMEALKRATEAFGVDDPKTEDVADELFRRGFGAVVESMGGERSLDLIKPAVRETEKSFGADHRVTFLATMTLAYSYEKTPLHAEAEPVFRSCWEQARRSLDADHDFRVTALDWFAKNQLHLHKHSEAESLLTELLRVRERTRKDHWLTFNTRSLLGGAIMGQAKSMLARDADAAAQRLADAESHLLSGFHGMKALETEIPDASRIRLSEAAQRLVTLYETRGDAKKVAKWKAELIRY